MRLFFNFFLSIFLYLAILISSATADPRVIGGGVSEINSSAQTKTDFHIEVSSDTNMLFQTALCFIDGEFIFPSNIQGDGTWVVTIEWDGLSISNGEQIHCVWIMTQEEYNTFFVKIHFTPDDGSRIPGFGWKVTPSGQVFLLNRYPFTIEFEDLEIHITDYLDEEKLYLWEIGEIEGTRVLESGEIPPYPGALYIGSYPVAPGEYLLSRANTRIGGTTVPITTVSTTAHEGMIVELVDVSAVAQENGIHVNWTTASEQKNAGFVVWRGEGENCLNGEYVEVKRITDVIPAKGNSLDGFAYPGIQDLDVIPGKTYCYGVADIEDDAPLNAKDNPFLVHVDFIDSVVAE